MRSRSPSRRSTPPPPRISRRSPGGFRTRGKSPDRRRRMPPPSIPKYVPGGRGGSPTRGRNRREFRHSPRSQPPGFPLPRRSRSPLQREPKTRSFSPGKRKLSPKRERERERPRDQGRERERRSRPPIASPRKRTRSKSPEASAVSSAREGGRVGSYGGSVGGPSDVSPPGRSYQGLPGSYPQGGPGPEGEPPNRNIMSMSERFHGPSGPGSYKTEQSDHPVFRGPEGTGFDVNELKKITVDIRRNLPVDMVPIERSIINPEDVVLVRRPEMMADEREYTLMIRDAHTSRGRYESDVKLSPSSGRKMSWERETNHYLHNVNKREGSHPIFAREEIAQASTRGGGGPIDEHRRVVAIVGETPPIQSQGSSRFGSPGRYADAPSRSHGGYYPSGEREPPRDYSHSAQDYDRGHGPAPGFDHKERSREDRFDRRSEDLRHELEQRRRDDSRYLVQGDGRRYDRSMDYKGDSDRVSSDLRMRINEKRTDRHDDRDLGHTRMMEHRPEPMERGRERERPHRGMMQHSPPGSERRQGPGEGFGRSVGDGKMRGGSGGGRVVHHGGPTNSRDDVPDRFHQEPTEFSSQQSDRFHYKSWDSNPEHVPKGQAYFEHDNREDEFMRGRGRGMLGQRGSGMHGRGMMRGRPFRGGGPTHIFMGRSGRRGGYPPRYTTRPSSPHWEHDLFDNLSADDCGQASNNSHGK